MIAIFSLQRTFRFVAQVYFWRSNLTRIFVSHQRYAAEKPFWSSRNSDWPLWKATFYQLLNNWGASGRTMSSLASLSNFTSHMAPFPVSKYKNRTHDSLIECLTSSSTWEHIADPRNSPSYRIGSKDLAGSLRSWARHNSIRVQFFRGSQRIRAD